MNTILFQTISLFFAKPNLENRFQIEQNRDHISQNYNVCKLAPPPQTFFERILDGAREELYCTENRIQEIPDSEPLEGYCWGGWNVHIENAQREERGLLVNRSDSITSFVNHQCKYHNWNNIWFINPKNPEKMYRLPPPKEGYIPRAD